MNILLIEDSDTFASYVTSWLVSKGHCVTGARMLGSVSFSEDGYDIILCDLWLPDGSPADVISKVAEKTHPPVILMTGGPITSIMNLAATMLVNVVGIWDKEDPDTLFSLLASAKTCQEKSLPRSSQLSALYSELLSLLPGDRRSSKSVFLV